MKKILLALGLITGLALAQNAQPTRAVKIINAATTTGVHEVIQPWGAQRTYQASGFTSAGAGASAIEIQVSDDCVNYIVQGTISLTLGTAITTDGFATDAHWKCVRPRVLSISGTGATVSVWMGN